MIRKELRKRNNKRLTFIGKVEKFGSKPNWHGYPEKTILFKDVRFEDSNKLATDHIWFTVRKTIQSLNLSVGDLIKLDARIGEYVKGYINHREGIFDREIDYKLNYPTNFVKVVNTK